MPFTLQQLSDLEDIKQLKSAYFRCIDTGGMEELRTLLTEDISIDLRGGSYRARLTGRNNMVNFIGSAFNSDVIAMHQGHGPEISFVDDDTAKGLWYLQDIFIDPIRKTNTIGSSIYKDVYKRESDGWKINVSEYDRIYEMVVPIEDLSNITYSHLSKHGWPPEKRVDVMPWLEFYD